MWNDIEWPDAGKGADEWGLAAILGRYLAAHPEATINDRWGIPFHGYLTREYTHVDEPLPEKVGVHARLEPLFRIQPPR